MKFPMNSFEQGQLAKCDGRSINENPYSMFSSLTCYENWIKGFEKGNF